uniref:Uncharacterized protein n=1 Tax=Anguilla anguilla TaxID=7936 RepID=A0A0E9T401_ANGAN
MRGSQWSGYFLYMRYLLRERKRERGKERGDTKHGA